jgi:hypothetical protein
MEEAAASRQGSGDPEEKFHRKLRRLAREAIDVHGWDLARWVAECRDAWREAYMGLKHQEISAKLAEAEKANLQWQANLARQKKETSGVTPGGPKAIKITKGAGAPIAKKPSPKIRGDYHTKMRKSRETARLNLVNPRSN